MVGEKKMLGKFTRKMLDYAVQEETENAILQHGLFSSYWDFEHALKGEIEEVKVAFENFMCACESPQARVNSIEKYAKALQNEITQVIAVINKRG